MARDVLQSGLNLEEILKKAGKPLYPVEAYEFANDLPHNPERRTFPGRTELLDSLWGGMRRGIIRLTADRRMTLK